MVLEIAVVLVEMVSWRYLRCLIYLRYLPLHIESLQLIYEIKVPWKHATAIHVELLWDYKARVAAIV